MENFVILTQSKFLTKMDFQLLLNSSHIWNQSTHNILSDIIGKSIGMRILFCVRQPLSLTSVHLNSHMPTILASKTNLMVAETFSSLVPFGSTPEIVKQCSRMRSSSVLRSNILCFVTKSLKMMNAVTFEATLGNSTISHASA